MNYFKTYVNDKIVEIRTGFICPLWKMKNLFHKLRGEFESLEDSIEVEFSQAIEDSENPENNEQGQLLYMWEEEIDGREVMFSAELIFDEPLSDSDIEKFVLFNY